MQRVATKNNSFPNKRIARELGKSIHATRRYIQKPSRQRRYPTSEEVLEKINKAVSLSRRINPKKGRYYSLSKIGIVLGVSKQMTRKYLKMVGKTSIP